MKVTYFDLFEHKLLQSTTKQAYKDVSQMVLLDNHFSFGIVTSWELSIRNMNELDWSLLNIAEIV
jgi:hypothetical protein